MKIVIDGRMINESGIGRYIRNLIEQLRKIDKGNEYYILRTNLKWYGITEQIKLPGILNKLKPDLVHFPHFNVPILYNGKFVVTIHDLIHQHFNMQRATTHGSLIYKVKQLGYKKVFQHAIKKSLKIFAPSKFVRNQLVDEWQVDQDKIVVTPEAVDDKIQTAVAKMSTDIQSPYIFYVGNAHPHKNVEGLIKAFLKLKEKYKDLSLMLSGQDNYFWQRIKMDSRFRGNDILYTGYVSDEELVALYKNALCFVQPSFEEGFGIPILEAFALGCPVVSSHSGALPEVGGEAVLYFDPKNIGDMVDKIDRVVKNKNLRKNLIEKGKKRVKLFSWKKLAQQTLEVYTKCMLQ